MATFTDRLRILLDWEGEKAEGAIKRFSTSVREADGFRGKMAAGWTEATQTIQKNAGAVAAVAGAALVTFGVKAVGAFTDTAKAASDMAKATGLSVEEASRWIAVGDDYGVSADNLTTSLAKVGKELDSSKWAKYGIATRDAAGNARSANDVLLDALEVLNNTKNGTERTRIATELFGRSWANIAPILGHTRAEYEKMLGSVEDGQVITAEEEAKAERWRLAMDKLQDALREVMLAVGEVVANMAPMLDRIADAVGYVTKLNESLGLLDKAATVVDFTNPITGAQRFSEEVGTLTDGIRVGLNPALREEAEAATGAGDEMLYASGAAAALAKEIEPVETYVRKTASAADRLRAALDKLSDEEADMLIEDAFDEMRAAAEEAYLAGVSGAEDFAEKQDAARRAVLENADAVAEYATEVLGIPASKVTDVIALLDMGKLAEAEALLNRLAMTRTARVVPVVTVGGQDYTGGGNTGDIGGSAPRTGDIHQSGVGGITRGTTLNVNVNVSGVVTGTHVGQEIAGAIQAWVNDGGNAEWMG